MRRSTFRLFFAATLALTPLSIASTASAQAPVSDADREAARNLFKEGFDLQAAGNYADALDRFKRSQQVYPAPTALLHIAECEARLLRLVEAAETYRALARQQLAPGAPPAFFAAQTQGAAELQQIEPRIPHVRVDVTPPNVQNLSVWIDEQPLNVALLGVDRPIDPGNHKFTAQAPGYDRTEIMVRVDEKQPTRMISLPLKQATGAAVGVAPVPYPVQPQVVYVQAPPPVYPVPQYPTPIAATPATVSPTEELSRKGIFFGPRLGYVYPVLPSSLNGITGGFSLGVEFDFRFARRFYLGAVVDHGFLGTTGSGGTDANGNPTSGPTYSTTDVELVFGVITNPDKFGALFQFGAGYRVMSASDTVGDSVSLSSPEASLSAGLWIPIGEHFRLAPRIDTSFGSLSGSISDSSGQSVSTPSYGYAMVAFVLAAYPNFNFH